MRLVDHTCEDLAENLALDEALLEESESIPDGAEWLRIWEPYSPLVVLGRSSRIESEVNLEVCRREGIPVYRRASGGATIVTGPGCLMYAVVLNYERSPHLRLVDAAHRHVLGMLAAALAPLIRGASHVGTSDLAVNGRKFSGNSLRARREHLLYHGTLLYSFPLPLISTCLATAPRQPAYRAGRSHDQFVMNLGVKLEQLRAAVLGAFGPTVKADVVPWGRTKALADQKYRRREWNEEGQIGKE